MNLKENDENCVVRKFDKHPFRWVQSRLKAERSLGQWKIMSTGENGVSGNEDEW